MTLYCVYAICGIHVCCWGVQMLMGLLSGLCAVDLAACAAPDAWNRILKFSFGQDGFSVTAILGLAPTVIRAFTGIFWMDYTWMKDSGYMTVDTLLTLLRLTVLIPWAFLFFDIVKSRLGSRSALGI